ncbi:hypothetical protein C1H76_3585 [Elsinoe australis]|uniref:N-acetylglucosaminylphosphatidylinositol deacetylase n=1 Tax=Elsinoe australis TaxID=40998 RepID=A0A4U7B7S8_9PEZI|nr:hypothetical protein C1H76_3585 [Elsinoe australis]
MGLVALLALPIAVTILWFALVKIVKQVCQYPASKRICLLIAHCDDEAMFFSPTVIRLADPSLNNHFEIICLSNGEEPALRRTRTSELLRSATNLGLKAEVDVTCLDDEDSFPDSMTTYWSPEKVAGALTSKYPADCHPPLDMLITFDHKGISSHANHISLLHGAMHWIKSQSSARPSSVALYSLITTNIVRKYVTLLDAPLSLVLYLLQRDYSGVSAPRQFPNRLFFFSAFSSYRRAQRSMTACHKSQMLWFR